MTPPDTAPEPFLPPATHDLLGVFAAAHHAAREGTLESTPAALAKALDAYLSTDWRAFPSSLEGGLSHLDPEKQTRIFAAVTRMMDSVQYVWDNAVKWEDTASPGERLPGYVKSRLPAFTARAMSTLISSRLLAHSDAEIEIETRLIEEKMRTAIFCGRIREVLATHKVSLEQAAPAIFAAASAIEHGTPSNGQPQAITFGDKRIPVTTNPALYHALLSSSVDPDREVDASLRSGLRGIMERSEFPDVSTLVTFESRALGIDRKAAAERVVESVFLARREQAGAVRESAVDRLSACRHELFPHLDDMAHNVRSGQALFSLYERAWELIDREKLKQEEIAERAAQFKKGVAPEPVEIPIPAGFDGLTAFGLYLQESIAQGTPLSVVWNQIADWGETTENGGFTLSPDEQAELTDLTAYAALAYATDFAASKDPMIERIVHETNRPFLRERLREIEVELRGNPQLSDEEMTAIAEVRLTELASTGAIREIEIQKFVRGCAGMIDRVRAQTEVRRLIAHRSITKMVPSDVTNDLSKLPHARRYQTRVIENPLWKIPARNGQSLLDLQNAVVARARVYREDARYPDANVEDFDNPTDRWPTDIARQVGPFRKPQDKRIRTTEKEKEAPGHSQGPTFGGYRVAGGGRKRSF